MRPIRRMFPGVSTKLLVITFLFLIVSFAAYIGFTEKHPYRQFGYFNHATRVPQMNMQKSTQNAGATHKETEKVILSLDNTAQQQDAVTRPALNNNLDAKGEHAKDGSVTSASIEKQKRDSFIGSAANKKQDGEELRPLANKMQAKNWTVTPTANKKQSKSIIPVLRSKEEKNNDVVPDHKQEKQFEAKYVAPASTTKQTKRTLKETYTSLKLSTKVESVSIARDHNASDPGTLNVTRAIPAATHKKRLKASDFKSEPRWDFDDQYLLDNSTPQSTCPNSLRVKAAKSDWLQGIFLPNITLFMDRSHFTDSEWERMEHFPPPFGFMELNYSLVKEVITMLSPKPYHQILMAHNSSQASRCITCAVVGNGGILNNSRMGQEIDSHDYVFRVSGAVIKGYERDVGTRTSFYGFTAYSLMSSLLILGNHGFKKIPMGKEIKYLHFLEGERDYEWLKALLLNKEVRKGFLDYYGKKPREKFDNFSLDKYFVVHPDFLRYIKNRFLKSQSLDKSYWRLYRPTTGAFILLTALHLCDQVSAYGYITEGYQKYSDHYYDKEWKRLIFYLNHDFDLERGVWKKLHDANIMKLYQQS
ncbi:alpha-N-acetylgalactosaminide alpha-2,6-sialyltransferase 1 [Eublepharis macularius]|uniref:alpha-N-acetylgalactosaminide alpha-2,6-sialyltransferase n=1 Tax=Eublepharis macularius TaxID=481883 RepID=A0AA97KTR8_EUBMA|nr:alpha-N-acetylgalactosaminide alpha-2,6-sialyltransferase 1 [Eublepharis macularius]